MTFVAKGRLISRELYHTSCEMEVVLASRTMRAGRPISLGLACVRFARYSFLFMFFVSLWSFCFFTGFLWYNFSFFFTGFCHFLYGFYTFSVLFPFLWFSLFISQLFWPVCFFFCFALFFHQFFCFIFLFSFLSFLLFLFVFPLTFYSTCLHFLWHIVRFWYT